MRTGFRNQITRRKIQIALAGLWLIDGVLQLQPRMFTSAFARKVLLPASIGQPVFVNDPMHFIIRLILHQPAVFTALFGLIQLGIGLLILYKSTARIGLIVSIIWGLLVWYLGEGLGGLFGGHALLLTGAPGASLLYVILAAAVMVPSHENKENQNNSVHPSESLVYAWALLWMGGSILLLIATHGRPDALAKMVSLMANGSPRWLAVLNIHFANWLKNLNAAFMIPVIFVYIGIGLMGTLNGRLRLIGVSCGILLALLFWVFGQSFGTVYSGLATDLNTAPLIVLLGIAVLGTKEHKLNLFTPAISD
jgi:hypothetical protein